MKKRYTITIIALILIGLGFSVYQYIETMKTEIVSATQTIPNPGHSWAQMESGPDSIQVSGRTITNLAAPVASTDATNKDYVDAAGGTQTYTMCYAQKGGSACASGFTSLAHYTGGHWVADNALGTTGAGAFAIGVGGSVLEISLCDNYRFAYSTYGIFVGCLDSVSVALPGAMTDYPGGGAVSFDGAVYMATPSDFLAVCCK